MSVCGIGKREGERKVKDGKYVRALLAARVVGKMHASRVWREVFRGLVEDFWTSQCEKVARCASFLISRK